ncbi:hypothetical protein TH5_24460 [Thalassospira xianhensis MCCC 1A02616]|uniref:site-specific DNA-methyltransferase (adenine-specific) n=1 Tax=Thalassospira xianhensis MCCC 1A02616 TaxID=1177929 RepID=A0A367U6H2_9PROT|nr:hypothetical protein TH5_24460 [Thalassospira xianhensis MCCC 1A02616]
MKWEDFKKTFPHQQPPYSGRGWGGAVHSMCSYQGKMKPSLAHHLIHCFSEPNDVIVDPFSGCGTIPFEACRMGRSGYGIDISRLGHVLTLGKVGNPSWSMVEQILCDLEACIDHYKLTDDDLSSTAAIKFNGSIPEYFHSDTLREIIAARGFFLSSWDSGAEWALIYASTMHLLHGNRPYALSRNSHPVTPYSPTGPFEYRALMPRLRAKLDRLKLEIVEREPSFGGSVQGDCTEIWPAEIPAADVIITSPPFFASTRFYMTNWMRFWFSGWERADFDVRPADYVETKQRFDLNVYRKFFASARERLKSTGIMVLHLGESKKCNMSAELALRVDPWFSVADCFTESVEHCELHGIRDKGAVTGHSYLVLVPKLS